MNINTQISQPENFFNIRQNGWKYYNSIKKKAMEQEFSWAGLFLSMSIAFFIVTITAYSLGLLHTSFKKTRLEQKINQQIYILEAVQINSANFSSFI